MANRPLVSVCVPTYNYGRFLPDCIESVLSQTFSDWELLICDDSSTDNTPEIVAKYAKNDPRIRFLDNRERLGMNGNIRRAAEAGTGTYLKMLCADDWLAPNCLAAFVELMENEPTVAIAASAETLSNEAGEPLSIQFLFGQRVSVLAGEEMLDRMAKGQGFGGHSSFFFRASAYRAVGGYDERCKYAADYDLAARMCRIGAYGHLDEPLFFGRLQPMSSSSLNPKKLLDVIDWFEIPDRVFQPRAFANREWRRYQRRTAQLTAQYLVNIPLQQLRGEHGYARELVRLLLKHGNFLLGIPFLLFHIPARLYRRLRPS